MDGTLKHGEAADASTPPPKPMSAWAARRRFCLPVIAPGLFLAKSNQLIAPFIPIFIQVDLHGSVTDVSLVSMAASAGQLLCSVPAGILIAKIQYQIGSVFALCTLILISLLCFTASTVPVLAMLRFLNGATSSVWDISQKTMMAAEVPKHVKGRISATLAGSNRVAFVFASLLGGVFADFVSNRSIFLVRAALVLFSLVMLLVHFISACAGEARNSQVGPGVKQHEQQSGKGQVQTRISTLTLLRETWRDLAGAGVFCALLEGVRITYLLLLPLHCHKIGLTTLKIGYIVAVMRVFDALMTLFASGQIMDRYGQKASGVPSVLILGLAYGLTPMCESMMLVGASAVLFALGNGLSGGIVVSFSTGLAPDNARSQFLGMWKMVTASGGFLVPGLFGAVSDWSGSLETAALTISITCVFSALWLLLFARIPSREAAQIGGLSKSAPLLKQ